MASGSSSLELESQEQVLLRVDYDYEYDYKTRKVSIKAGELLILRQRTNDHWWKVTRSVNSKPFFVPKQYVTQYEGADAGDAEESAAKSRQKERKENGEKASPVGKLHSLSLSDSSPSQSPSTKSKGEASTKTKKETSFFSFAKSGSKGGQKISRNEGSRASHREKNSKHSATTKGPSSSKSGKLKNWSASLEELSKQIVFPGLASESVADLTFATREVGRRREDSYEEGHEADDDLSFGREKTSFSSFLCDNNSNRNVHTDASPEPLNKCLTFRNPNFDKGSGSGSADSKSPSEEKLEIGNSNHPDIKDMGLNSRNNSVNNVAESEDSISRSMSGSTPKEPSLPGTPLNSPIRNLADGWSEHYSPESNRYYYFNSQTKITSWKPPRNSSTKRSDEHLASSLSDGSANASSFEKSLENIPDLVGSPNLSFEAELSADNKTSNSLSDNDNVTNTILMKEGSGERSRSSESVMSIKEEEDGSGFGADEIPVPEGYDRQFDEPTLQTCYINRITGKKWFTSTDSQGRVYYYEENSSNSSWFLPVPSDATATHNRSQVSVSEENSETKDCFPPKEPTLDTSKFLGSVKKRHSAGEVADRALKTKSLLLSSDLRKQEFDKSHSLPRTSPSIWISQHQNVIREGLLSRSKFTENGKRIRKNWGVVYAVLTDSHLSIFKDHKSFLALTKTEVEIELEGASVEWTDKSSRKNVFQLSTPSDLQMLFQVDDKDVAEEWFETINCLTEKSDSTLDISMRLKSTESPDNMMDPPVGERKISSRLNRNKSTKLRITTVEDKERLKIKDHLRKFFSRRPPRESLVKKGIYKDESVFGCSLEKLCAQEKVDVPRFVTECIVAIESKTENLKTIGLYRQSGNLSHVQSIRLQVDNNNMASLVQADDIHVLSSCLKLFFRELKEPLIPSEMFEKALQACHAMSKKEKVHKLKDMVNSLPKANRCTLQALLRHLLKVAEFSEFNRMQIPNLAIVFGPTLILQSGPNTNATMATDLMFQNLVIEALLTEYESVFE